MRVPIQNEDRFTDLPALLAGALGPPLIWSGHLLISYYIAGDVCTIERAQRVAIIIALTVAAVLAVVACALVVWSRTVPRTSGGPTARVGHFLRVLGISNALLFGPAMIITAAPVLWLRGC